MQSRPPFYPQETPNSCVPACLRMVLAELGLFVSEKELRIKCDCTIFGTSALQAVEAMQQLGFVETCKASLSLAQLDELLAQNVYPIVYLQMMPIDRIRMIHASVLIGMDDDGATILDPIRGERVIAKPLFDAAFRSANNLAILVINANTV